MGIRLHPKSEDPAVLEKLAGVPAGTHQRLKEREKKHKADLKALEDGTLDREISPYDLEYDQYCEIEDDPELCKMKNFLIYGWGKPRYPLPDNECCGTIPTADVFCHLMAKGVVDNGIIKLAEETGVSYC